MLDLCKKINYKVDKIKFKFIFSNIFEKLNYHVAYNFPQLLHPIITSHKSRACYSFFSLQKTVISLICFRARCESQPNHKSCRTAFAIFLPFCSRSRPIRRKDTHEQPWLLHMYLPAGAGWRKCDRSIFRCCVFLAIAHVNIIVVTKLSHFRNIFGF